MPRGKHVAQETAADDTAAMTAPESGVKVRMYRQGHGDCFLLAFRGKEGEPVYVLIDCGYKPGSSGPRFGLKPMGDIVEHIKRSTGGRLDLVVLTHEHQDHLNGIWKKNTPYFDGFTIGKAWLAWTEDPQDELAESLRKRHRDQLLGLIATRNRLAAAGDSVVRGRLEQLLALELGGDLDGSAAGFAADLDAATAAFAREPDGFAAAAKDPAKSANKQSIKLIKDRAAGGVRYISPHQDVMRVPGVESVRVFALGPPRAADLLRDEDPEGSEAFPDQSFMTRSSLFAAAQADVAQSLRTDRPFGGRFAIATDAAFADPEHGAFFTDYYGQGPEGGAVTQDGAVPNHASWRRIDGEWLLGGEELALQLNKGINNTSLVLAFELEKSGRVLLFAADAQRGNWRSWTASDWKDGDRTITAKDLLGRTVLYKVGHHGSHNATLNGTETDDYPNLGWMAKGRFASEFTAMIPAVRDWAYAQDPVWAHPQTAIKDELLRKAGGRVFQTDTGRIDKPHDVAQGDWQRFLDRAHIAPEYFEYSIPDD